MPLRADHTLEPILVNPATIPTLSLSKQIDCGTHFRLAFETYKLILFLRNYLKSTTFPLYFDSYIYSFITYIIIVFGIYIL